MHKALERENGTIVAQFPDDRRDLAHRHPGFFTSSESVTLAGLAGANITSYVEGQKTVGLYDHQADNFLAPSFFPLPALRLQVFNAWACATSHVMISIAM